MGRLEEKEEDLGREQKQDRGAEKHAQREWKQNSNVGESASENLKTS